MSKWVEEWASECVIALNLGVWQYLREEQCDDTVKWDKALTIPWGDALLKRIDACSIASQRLGRQSTLALLLLASLRLPHALLLALSQSPLLRSSATLLSFLSLFALFLSLFALFLSLFVLFLSLFTLLTLPLPLPLPITMLLFFAPAMKAMDPMGGRINSISKESNSDSNNNGSTNMAASQ